MKHKNKQIVNEKASFLHSYLPNMDQYDIKYLKKLLTQNHQFFYEHTF